MKKIPDVGQILISEPLLTDFNFSRSVILITSCDDTEGVFGHILNQESILQITEVTEIDQTAFGLYNGGPVETDSLFFIHRCFDRCQSGQHIFDDLYWGGDFNEIISLINKKIVEPHEVKFFMGYAGWSKNQLLEELDNKYWIVTNKFDKEFIFQNLDSYDYWKKAVHNLGANYKHLTNFPIHPNLN